MPQPADLPRTRYQAIQAGAALLADHLSDPQDHDQYVPLASDFLNRVLGPDPDDEETDTLDESNRNLDEQFALMLLADGMTLDLGARLILSQAADCAPWLVPGLVAALECVLSADGPAAADLVAAARAALRMTPLPPTAAAGVRVGHEGLAAGPGRATARRMSHTQRNYTAHISPDHEFPGGPQLTVLVRCAIPAGIDGPTGHEAPVIGLTSPDLPGVEAWLAGEGFTVTGPWALVNACDGLRLETTLERTC